MTLTINTDDNDDDDCNIDGDDDDDVDDNRRVNDPDDTLNGGIPTSCSISICHPDRRRLRGNLADMVMMVMLVKLMMVMLVLVMVMWMGMVLTH